MLKEEVILDFWFKETPQKLWFSKDTDFDKEIRTRFLKTHESAAKAETFQWRETPEGRLAEIIVLDQFSRNIFRDEANAFAFDAIALVLAQEAVRVGDDQKLPLRQRSFIYMPYMHSESLVIHQEAVRLFSQPGLEYNLDYELRHKKILERFGRYPHRNQVLARGSTPEEIEFLKEPGSSF